MYIYFILHISKVWLQFVLNCIFFSLSHTHTHASTHPRIGTYTLTLTHTHARTHTQTLFSLRHA